MFNFWPFNIARKRREAFEAYEAQRDARRQAEVEAFAADTRHKVDQAVSDVRRFAGAGPSRAPSRSSAFSAPYGRPTPAPVDSSHLFSPVYHTPSPSYDCAPSPSYGSSDSCSSSSDSGSSSCGCD